MKQLKYINILLLFFLINIDVSAQVLNNAPNFGLTNADGETFYLYEDVLDQGKIAVLIAFSISCQPCQENVPVANNWFINYGENQSELVVFGVETASFSDDADVEEFAINYGTLYPLYNLSEQDSITELMNITYTPLYYVICPDGSYRDYISDHVSLAIDYCLETVSVADDEINGPKLIVENQQLILSASANQTYQLTLFSLDARILNQSFLRNNEGISLNMASGIYLYRLINQETGAAFTGRFQF